MYFLIIVCRDQARVSHNKHTRKKYDWNVATQANAAKNHFLQRHFSISFVFCFFLCCVWVCVYLMAWIQCKNADGDVVFYFAFAFSSLNSLLFIDSLSFARSRI